MKLLLDENVSTKLKPLLVANGFDVVTVKDCSLLGKSDDIVFEYALKQNRIVVTQNYKDFIKQLEPKGIIPQTGHFGLFKMCYDITRALINQTASAIDEYYIDISTDCDHNCGCNRGKYCINQNGLIVKFEISTALTKIVYS